MEQHLPPAHEKKPVQNTRSLRFLIRKYFWYIVIFFVIAITSGVLLAEHEAKSTANWETYTSKDAGVTFQHPKAFTIIEDKGWRITAYMSEENPENNIKILYSHNELPDALSTEEQFLANCQAKRVSEITAKGGRMKVYEDSTCGGQVVENAVLVYAENGMTYDIGLFGKIDRTQLYLFLSTFSFEKAPITSSASKTIDQLTVKTYVSKDNSFSFQYPASWEKDLGDANYEVVLTMPLPPECKHPQACGGGFEGLKISKLANPNALSLQNFIKEDKQNMFNLSNFTKNPSSLGISEEWLIDRSAPGAGEGQEILITHKTDVLDLYCGNCNDETVDQILSTFTFTDKDEVTANWKQYTDKELGFTFKYPPDFEISRQTADSISFGVKATNGYITYLTINTKPKPYSMYNMCVDTENTTNESFVKQTPCISDKEQKTAIADTILGRRKAKSFYVVESAIDNDYHLVQTVDAPLIEAKMFVAGGGLDKTFTEILSTFIFTN